MVNITGKSLWLLLLYVFAVPYRNPQISLVLIVPPPGHLLLTFPIPSQWMHTGAIQTHIATKFSPYSVLLM